MNKIKDVPLALNIRFLPLLLCLIGVGTISACQPISPETIIKTVIVEKEGETIVETVVVTVEPTEFVVETEESEVEPCCAPFKIGIYEEPLSLNYWNYLGPGNSVWTRYVISNNAAHLFELSDQDYRFVPSLAMDIPVPQALDDGTWEITVAMSPSAYWSDGQPITATDVVFTHNICKNLALTWYWQNYCSPDGAEILAEVVDNYTVKYTFLNQEPNLRNWQFGAALSPILPAHYWEETASHAFELIEQVEVPTADRPDNCGLGGITVSVEALCQAWDRYDEAYDLARELLYTTDAQDQPVAGGYMLEKWQFGDSIQFDQNPDYFFSGSEIVEFSDGTWMRVFSDGRELKLYGEGGGVEMLRYRDGPYNPEVVYLIYGSQEAAFGALIEGEVDYVLNPIGLPRELRDQLQADKGIETYVNPDYGMYYLAFNLRKYPMSESEFRQVFDVLIDRELVISEVLGDAVFPLYSTMPATNIFWHNPDLTNPYQDLNRAERVEIAVNILKEAGWRWGSEPYWDEFVQDVIPGEGLVMPDGQPMPELTILGPGPDFDIVRATFNQWVSEWARELGMPVQSELTGRNAILDSVFVAGDYDMYIFGSPLGDPAYPEYFAEFWYSNNCTFETGGMNTTCFKDDAYDTLLDEFIHTGDLKRARELVYEMQQILYDQRPFIPLYSEKVYDFARRDVIFPMIEVLGGIQQQDGYLTSTKVMILE